ncbi:MAG TPA: OmpA family protein [Thermoanaerobaculia bacterium]|nr:OmpA family protein [Thermoanaerobaculia bacterium]
MKTRIGVALSFLMILAVPMLAQTEDELARARAAIAEAEAAMNAAVAAGAPVYAKELHDEATARLNLARANFDQAALDRRQAARLRAVEAEAAFRASEAWARLRSAILELENLSGEIASFGGSVPAGTRLVEPALSLQRGDTSAERVEVARRMMITARSAGADALDRKLLEEMDARLGTAEQLAKQREQSHSADHLAYVAEMEARRLYALARLAEVQGLLPGLRMERGRLAQLASEARAAEELRQRQESERRAAELRQRLQNEAAMRRMQQEEIDRLRRQVAEHEAMLRTRFDEDRQARLAAERELDRLMTEYERALLEGGPAVELGQLRRRIDDQRLELEQIRERERSSEQSVRHDLTRLEEVLERERRLGTLSASDLRQREEEIRLQERELERLRAEREERERERQDHDRAFQQRVAAVEERMRQAEAQTAQLRQQLEEERARAATAQAELERSQRELEEREQRQRQQLEEERARAAAAQAELERSQREVEEREQRQRQQFAEMQQRISEIADTRRDARGLIVTLPGIFFDTGKSELKSGTRNTIDKLVEQLTRVENMSILIEGHTDSTGSEEMNMKLSLARANAVRDYLVSSGVPAARIQTSGRGEEAPVASNDTTAGRQQNRRVELVIRELD